MSQPTPTTILCVDDEEAIRSAFTWLFRQEGFVVCEAASGKEAIEVAQERKPDLVILDVSLPDLDGFEVCRRIRSHPATATIPVLHISARFVKREDRVHGFELGADGYLVKPVEPQELVAHARALLRTHQAEEEARAAAREWQTTFDALRDGAALLDRDGRIRRCNRALAQLLEKPVEALIGLSCEQLTRPSSPLGEGVAHLFRTRSRETVELTWEDHRLQAHVDPMYDDLGGFRGAVLTLSDITERYRLEEQLRQAQKLEAVGRLAGGVAHDFNNLLTAITGNVSLLLADLQADDPAREILQLVDKAAWRAADLVRRLLGFSRKNLLVLQPLNLNHSVAEAVELLRRTIDPRIAVEVRVAPDLWSVPADPGLMNQVLMNLCLNARDAMPGGGRVMLETANVRFAEGDPDLSADGRPGEFVRLRVRDTGQGIAPEVRSRIFEPFFTTKEPGKGTGLGLAMVFGIVKQHQGWIDCRSEIGRGTSFDIYLPRLGIDVEPAARPPSLRVPSGGQETILLVDDEPTLRMVGSKVLQQFGYRVLLAEDGQDAVDVYRQEKGTIDLVVMDMTMPRLSGKEALVQLREIDPDVCVVLASGYTTEEIIDIGEPNVGGFIQKPYVPQQLAAVVRAALDQAKVGVS